MSVQDSGASFLDTLNAAQRRAVTHPPHVPLQILAGPGSGKTHVLTCRIAHLVSLGILPQRICAVTFTNKAANEMKERLLKLIGPADTSKLIMGTFHAICARFLRQYGKIMGLDTNFTICDADESKKLVTKGMKDLKEEMDHCGFELSPRDVASAISKAKSKDLTPAQVAVRGVRDELTPPGTPPNLHHVMLSKIYEEYQAALKRNNALDFDDLLAHGVRLLDHEPRISAYCEHVLVDEFQDTNVCQYKLMVQLASQHQCVTIVGDPDQSIYGWRAAEVENLHRMTVDFQGVQQVMLEQNYRSTQSILRTAMEIMAEDKKRIPKTLYSGHHQGTLPLLRQCADEKEEGDFMAMEIKRLIAHSGGILKYSDFAVLLRFNALSRAIETSLQREGIPHKVLKGRKFFERMEVKDLLAYLQLVDNPNFTPAFQRAINTPPRAIGDKSLTELFTLANTHKISPMEAVEGIVSGRLPDIKPTAKRKLIPFVSVMRRLRKDAAAGVAPNELLRIIVDQVHYAEHLKKSEEDHESRMENVQELISFAAQEYSAIASAWSITQDEATAASDEEKETPLRLFLQASMLASDADGDHSEEGPKDEVIISTCHAAKGLEWPVVFIPAVAAGIFPHSRTEDFDEERRLLYVACTRAKAYLFLSHSEKRPQAPKCDLSPFIATVKNRQMIFTDQIPSVDQPAVRQLSLLLRREEPQKEVLLRMIQEHTAVIAARTTQAQVRSSANGTVRISGPTPMPDAMSVQFSSAKSHIPNPYSASFTSSARSGIQTVATGSNVGGGFVSRHARQDCAGGVPPSQQQQQQQRFGTYSNESFDAYYSDPDVTISTSMLSNLTNPHGSNSSTAHKTGSPSSKKSATASKLAIQTNTLDAFVKRPSPQAAPTQAAPPPSLSVTSLPRTYHVVSPIAPLDRVRPSSSSIEFPISSAPLSPSNLPAVPHLQTKSFYAQPHSFQELCHSFSLAGDRQLESHSPSTYPTCKTAMHTPPSPTSSRKRLGMGRAASYVNKKFKSHHVSDP